MVRSAKIVEGVVVVKDVLCPLLSTRLLPPVLFRPHVIRGLGYPNFRVLL